MKICTDDEYINRERARFEAKRYFKNMDEIQEDLDMLRLYELISRLMSSGR